MLNFFRCIKCLFPNTKPSLHFDSDGVCAACKFTSHHEKEINWDKRRESFDQICRKIKKCSEPIIMSILVPVLGFLDLNYSLYNRV